MKLRFPLAIRLSTLPLAAVLAIVFLSGLTILDLVRDRGGEDLDNDKKRRPVLRDPTPEKKVPLTADVPGLSEEEALAILKDRPTRAAVARLWPLQGHRDTLFKVLLDPKSREEVRLFVLGKLEQTDPGKAVEAARAMASEKDLGEGPMLLSALEILSLNGRAEDIALFAERPGESHQLKSLREEYRDALQNRNEHASH